MTSDTVAAILVAVGAVTTVGVALKGIYWSVGQYMEFRRRRAEEKIAAQPAPAEKSPEPEWTYLKEMSRNMAEACRELAAIRGSQATVIDELRAIQAESRRFRVTVFGHPDGDVRPEDIDREAERERVVREYMRQTNVDRPTAEARLHDTLLYSTMRIEP